MSKTTKEDILIVALHLFARDGYEAVSVSQIAGELGMTKGALYRHYESKRDIFEHIVKRMEQGDGEPWLIVNCKKLMKQTVTGEEAKKMNPSNDGHLCN